VGFFKKKYKNNNTSKQKKGGIYLLFFLLLFFYILFFFIVVMRNTSQVTNQSSHGELSFHHNPHLLLCRDLCLSTFRVIRRGGTRLKNAAHPSYCHCCELCALKQKPGVLLDIFFQKKIQKTQIPTANRTHHRIRSPSIECSGT